MFNDKIKHLFHFRSIKIYKRKAGELFFLDGPIMTLMMMVTAMRMTMLIKMMRTTMMMMTMMAQFTFIVDLTVPVNIGFPDHLIHLHNSPSQS